MKSVLNFRAGTTRRPINVFVALTLTALDALSLWGQAAPDIVWKKNGQSSTVGLSPDGTRLASGGYVWRTGDASLFTSLSMAPEDIYSVAFSPDGEYLGEGGGGGFDRYESEVRIWRTSDWGLVTITGDSAAWESAVAFSKDSDILGWIGESGNRLALWKISEATYVGTSDDTPPGGASALAFSPTARTVVTGGGDGSVTVWDYTNGLSDQTILATYPGQSAAVSAVAFLPDGTQLASASYDSTVVIRRLADGAITRTFQDSNAVVSIAVSPDGKLLLTSSTNLKFWRISDGTLLKTYDLETGGVGPVAITADGKNCAYGRADGVIVFAWMPLLINSASRTASETILRWQGGSGLYQVQASTNLANGSWQNLGEPTTNTSATNSLPGGNVFYRVQSLPNP